MIDFLSEALSASPPGIGIDAGLLDSTSRRDIIEPVVGKIISGIGQPIAIGGGGSVRGGASIGATVFEGDAVTRDELVRDADEAMYRAKSGGRNTFRFVDEEVGG